MASIIRFEFIFLIFLLPINTSAQESPKGYQFKHISTDHGLSQGNVTSIIQDKQGFMWIGTHDGLNRYDGYNLTIYRHVLFDSTSISDNVILALFEDSSGIIWIGTGGGGLNRFDPVTEKFRSYKTNPHDTTSLSHDVITAIIEDQEGTLWVGTEGGLNRFDSSTNTFRHYKHAANNSFSLSNNEITAIKENDQGELWISTHSGLNLFDPATEHFKRFLHDPNNRASLSDNVINALSLDEDGNVWIGTQHGGLNRFDPVSGLFQHYQSNSTEANSIKYDNVEALHIDQSGKIWIGFNNQSRGLDQLDRVNGKFQHVHSSASSFSYLENNAINTFYEDRAGLLWIGTSSAGIARSPLYFSGFELYRHNPNNPNSLSDNGIRGIHEDKNGYLWIGTDLGGLNRFDHSKGTFKHYRHNKENPLSISNDDVQYIYEDDEGMLWIATYGGLNRFDPASETFQHFQFDPEDDKSLSNNSVVYLHGDRAGKIWVSTWGGGLNHFNPHTGEFERYSHNPNNANSISHDRVLPVHEDKQGNVWIGTFGGGLSRFDPTSKRFKTYRHDPSDSTSLSDNRVFSLHEEVDGQLWIGTMNGLNKFDPVTETFSYYREEDGLSNNTIYGILSDRSNNLWLSTNWGLSQFNPKTETFINYDIADGLQNNEFNSVSFFRNDKGKLFFGGINGLNAFIPENITVNSIPPPIVFTAFKKFNQSVQLDTSITVKKHIDLSFDDDVISFEFTALDYRAPEQNAYAYKLEGFNDHWISLENKHDITFTNLSAGWYTLRIKGSNNANVWNEDGTSIRLHVLPAFWETLWFRGFAITLLGLIIFSGHRLRVNKLRQNQKTLEDRVSERTLALRKSNAALEKAKNSAEAANQTKSQFLANVSHELRTPLMLIFGPLSDLYEQRFGPLSAEAIDHIRLARRNADRLYYLINELLDLSRLEANQMKPVNEYHDINTLLQYLVSSFSVLATENKIGLEYIAPEHSIEFYYDQDLLERVFTNLLTNAFKFTPQGGKIRIKAALIPNNKVEISIRDSGIGIPEQHIEHIFDRFYRIEHKQLHPGSGIGLAYSKEIVELHNGQLNVESVEGFGSTFTVTLPKTANETSFEPETLFKPTHSYAEVAVSEMMSNAISGHVDLDHVDQTTILVVDDEDDVRTYICNHLRPTYRVIEATNGLEALEKVKSFLPDLVISDVMMPEMDGLKFTNSVKRNLETNYIAVILLTANAAEKIPGLEVGADDYLVKPFDVFELKLRIGNLLATRKNLSTQRLKLEKHLVVSQITATSEDELFLTNLQKTIEEHMGDDSFSVEKLAGFLGQSRSTLHRRLKELLDQTPSNLIRNLRLQRAAQLIEAKAGTISEVAYAVGFKSVSHFSRAFNEHYGQSPSMFASTAIV